MTFHAQLGEQVNYINDVDGAERSATIIVKPPMQQIGAGFIKAVLSGRTGTELELVSTDDEATTFHAHLTGGPAEVYDRKMETMCRAVEMLANFPDGAARMFVGLDVIDR